MYNILKIYIFLQTEGVGEEDVAEEEKEFEGDGVEVCFIFFITIIIFFIIYCIKT